ncbi:MAG: Lrp/AsnC family transcriptional regulator [Thermoprotei archaeon]
MLNEFDRKLLAKLQTNARVTNRELAKELGVSSVTVAKHLQKLEREGYIQKYIAVLSPDKLGYSIEAAVEVSVVGGHIVEIEQELSRYPNVYAVYDVTGETDVLLLTRFRTREDLSSFVKKVLGMPNVVRTNTRLILTTVKRSLETPLDELTPEQSV